MKQLIIIYILFMIIIMTLSCGKLILGSDPENTPFQNFDLLWKDYDEHYARFDDKDVNWDSLYSAYRREINIYTDDLKLSRFVGAMLLQLKDMHAVLRTHWGDYRYWDLIQGDYRHHFQLDHIKENYLVNYEIYHIFTYGKLNDDLGYIHIRTFGKPDIQVSFDYFDTILQGLTDLKGIVLDVRDNDGGISSHAQLVASRLTDERRLFRYWRFRNGPRHTDFTDFIPDYTEADGNHRFTKPTVLLTNRFSASATEEFILRLRVCPHVTVIGDTTSGGLGGQPITRELPNGWVYRIPTAKELTSEYENFEGTGIPPDIPVWITEWDSIIGRDTILDKAIQILSKN